MRLKNIFEKMEVEVLSLQENSDFETLGLASSEIKVPFCTFIEKPEYISGMSSFAKTVLTSKATAPFLDETLNICIVEDPRNLFFDIHNYLQNDKQYRREVFPTTIGQNCRVSSLSSIAKDNVIIGNNVTIEEFVVIRENTTIGDNTVIRAGVIVGGEGFEFKKKEGILVSVKHLGGVHIGDNVELQQNTCVDKAIYPWDNTILGSYTKTDNLVHVAHGVKTGKNVLITANATFSGRVTVGDNSWIGVSSTMRNGISVGSDARVNIGSVVTRSVEDHASVTGNFAIDHKQFIQQLRDQNKKVKDE